MHFREGYLYLGKWLSFLVTSYVRAVGPRQRKASQVSPVAAVRTNPSHSRATKLMALTWV